MLLCRERYDFTVFHLYEKLNRNPPEAAAKELIDVLKNRGKILSIEKFANYWEIWLAIDEEAFVYYLFNCDDWVIQC
jgi:ubiquitin C-terminal hydrolase